jgi:hypothetical protein
MVRSGTEESRSITEYYAAHLMAPVDFAHLKKLHLALEPTRWMLLRAAATRPVLRAEDAYAIGAKRPQFKGSERTARYHATWLEKNGFLDKIDDEGLLAYQLNGKGRHLYDCVTRLLAEGPDASQPGTDSHLVAVVAAVNANEYEALTGDAAASYDVAAALRDQLGTLLTRRATIHVESEQATT